MTRLILAVTVLFPAAALAACLPPGAGDCASGHGCGAMSLVAMAAIAALGVWVLRSAEKDGGLVKRAGQVVGWTLAVVGLGGFLCGAASFAVKKSRACHVPPVATGMTLPPGHPPLVPPGK